MNNKERVTAILERKPVDYLPSNIEFSDMTREKELSEALNVPEGMMLDEYLDNCFYMTFVEDDLPVFFRNDDQMMLDLEKKGFAYVDLENELVYDRIGRGMVMHHDSVVPVYSALEGNAEKDKVAARVLPERFTKLFGLPLEEKIRKFEMPDPWVEGELDFMLADFAKYDEDGRFFVLPAGYWGVYETSHILAGWEQFMLEMALRPNMIHELMEKATHYKVELAKRKVKETPSILHHQSDDIATQLAGNFSLPMFREMILPYFKRVFEVYRDAGCHICFHSCGYIMDYIPDLIDIGVDMLEPIQTVNDLPTLKREYGKDLVFWGGIEVQRLSFWTPEETRENTKYVIHTLGKGGGLIIAPSQHLTHEVPIANLKAMIETIREERDKVV
jgi:uroporphyrinogen decarboxylase